MSSSPFFSGVRVAQSLVFCVVLCVSLLFVFIWSLYFLSFHLRLLITLWFLKLFFILILSMVHKWVEWALFRYAIVGISYFLLWWWYWCLLCTRSMLKLLDRLKDTPWRSGKYPFIVIDLTELGNYTLDHLHFHESSTPAITTPQSLLSLCIIF